MNIGQFELPENEQNELKSNEIQPITNYASALTVKTDADNIAAGEFLKTIKNSMKRINDRFSPIVKSAYEAHKSIKNLQNDFLKPLELAEQKTKTEMLTFAREVEAEQRRKQAEADAAARREEERKRKELEGRAAKWEAKGNTEKAECLKEQAETVTVAPPVIAKEMSKVQGISYRDNWIAIVDDASKLPREWLIPNLAGLAAFARATKGTSSIPGVTFKNEKTIASRGA